ncbi:MAG: lysophospholipid acyltransferase family protein [Siculibacillus sp.]
MPNPTVLRAWLFFVLLVIGAIPFVPLLVPLFLAPPRYTWWIVFAFLRMMQFLVKLTCGLDWVVTGRENIPAGPVLYASRHESIWEVLYFQMLFGNPISFAKREVFGYPVGGQIARNGDHIRVDRDGNLEQIRQAFAKARDASRAGRSVLIFPSGTRSVDGRDQVANGVAVLYGMLDLPCVPIVLDSGTYWPHRSWLKYPGTIHVRVLPPIPPGLKKGEFLERLRTELRRSPTGDEAPEPALTPARLDA